MGNAQRFPSKEVPGEQSGGPSGDDPGSFGESRDLIAGLLITGIAPTPPLGAPEHPGGPKT